MGDENASTLDGRLAAVMEKHDELVQNATTDCTEHDGDVSGQIIWRSAEVLCNFLGLHPQCVAGLRVAELGSGVGLCGVTAAAAGASSVVMTDGNLLALDLLTKNCLAAKSKSGADVEVAQLHWGAGEALDNFVEEKGSFDVVIAADVVYDLSCARSMFETARAMLDTADGQFLVSYVPR